MEYESINFMDFQRRFDSQQSCLEAIYDYRWPRGFVCPFCGHDDGTRLSKRHVIQCSVCRRQTSITAGTLFHKTKIPLTKWFSLIFMMSQDKGGISAVRAANLLGMHYTTVWNMMHKVREAMAMRIEREMLSGFVEIDDAFYGGKTKGKPGRALQNKRLVIVMVERLQFGAGDAAFVLLHNQNGDAFKEAVASHLEPMTHIRTDGYPTNGVLYNVGKLDMRTIGQDYSEEGPLKNVDRVISLSKRYLLGTYHQFCARAHLQRFLAEFTFRFNRRYRWCQLFSRVVAACALCPPVPYAAIS